jgi:type I restriction enzyme S subunit
MTPEIEKRIKAVQAGRVPAGYKKTPIGVVPKEWNMTSLKDIANHVIEKNKNNAVHLTLTNSATKGVIKQEDYFDKQISNNENTDGYYLVKDGDFIYNPRISVSAPCGPINCSHVGEIGIASPLYTVFRLKENVQNVDYIELYLRSPFWHRYMCGVANYGARHDRMNITNDDLFAMPLPIPPLSEQKKIAEILATQDRVIELKEKLIAEKQKQKKYLMSVLLGDDFKKPFKLNGVTIDKKKWEKKKIGEICDTFSGGTPSRSHPEYFNGEIPWIKSGELNQENIYETEEFLTPKGIECSSAKMVKKGTLLIAMYGATAGVLAVTHIDAAINQAILALIPNMDINPFYLKSAIANQIDVAVHRLVQGGQPNFNASIISAFELRLPTLPEQKAIADVLSAADEEISLLQKSLEQEKLKKKSLMQLLLTGLVRVNE